MRNAMMMILGVAVMVTGLLAVSSVQAQINDDFESGYTDSATIDGINGWETQWGPDGHWAYDSIGRDGGWGVRNVGGEAYNQGGSRRAHDLSLDAGSRIVLDVDTHPGPSDSYGVRIQFVDPDDNQNYILANIDPGAYYAFSAKYNSSMLFDRASTNDPTDEWHHVTVDWTVGGSITATFLDDDEIVVASWTEDLTGWGGTSLVTHVALYGRDSVGVFDNLVVEAGEVPLEFPGDANKDGFVNATDAAILAAHWLNGPDAVWGDGDFNVDGYVNDIDATIMAANWGWSAEDAAASVPEPGSLILLIGLIGLVGLGRFRR